jgi:hypothetical protein
MIFAFPHVYNMEFGGEFSDLKDAAVPSNSKVERAKAFIKSFSYNVFVTQHRSLGPVVICLEQRVICPSALIFFREGLLLESVDKDVRASSDFSHQLSYLLKKIQPSEIDAVSSFRRRTEGDLLETMTKKKLFSKVEKIDKKLKDSLLRACEIISPTKYKAGLLRMPAGTSYEDELFKVEEISPAFGDFLDSITDEGSTINGRFIGTEDEAQVLFHVGPYISLSAEKFVSHDPVVVVFKEGGLEDVFVPSAKANHTTQIFIVVCALPDVSGTPLYKVQVASKLRVDPFPPFLPQTAVFAPGKVFKDFMLTKIINGCRAASKVNSHFIQSLDSTLNGIVEGYRQADV